MNETLKFSKVVHPCDVPCGRGGKKFPLFCKIEIKDEVVAFLKSLPDTDRAHNKQSKHVSQLVAFAILELAKGK